MLKFAQKAFLQEAPAFYKKPWEKLNVKVLLTILAVALFLPVLVGAIEADQKQVFLTVEQGKNVTVPLYIYNIAGGQSWEITKSGDIDSWVTLNKTTFTQAGYLNITVSVPSTALGIYNEDIWANSTFLTKLTVSVTLPLSDIQSNLQSSIDDLKNDLTAEINNLGTQLTNVKNDIKNDISTIETDILGRIDQRVGELNDSIANVYEKRLSDLNETFEQEKADLQARIADLENQTESLETNLQLTGLLSAQSSGVTLVLGIIISAVLIIIYLKKDEIGESFRRAGVSSRRGVRETKEPGTVKAPPPPAERPPEQFKRYSYKP